MKNAVIENEDPTRTTSVEHLLTVYRVSGLLLRSDANGLEIDKILPRILQIAADELDVSIGTVFTIDNHEKIRHGWRVEGDTKYIPRYDPFFQTVYDEGVAGIAIRTGKPIQIDNTMVDDRWLNREGDRMSIAPWSAICAPMVVRQQAIGAITLVKEGAFQFSDNDLGVLDAIAGQAAISADNARLYADSQRRLKEAELINGVSRALNASLDAEEVLNTMLRELNKLLSAEAVSIALANHNGDELVYTAASGIGSAEILGLSVPIDTGISGWVMQNSKPVLTNDPVSDPRFSMVGDTKTGHKTKAMICAPVETRGNVAGTIQAINPLNRAIFTDDDLRLLVRLANLASNAIANAEQYEQTKAAEERYLNLFEDSIDPIILTTDDGMIVGLNKRASEFFGYGQHQLQGEPLTMLHTETVRKHADAVWKNNEIKVLNTQVRSQDGMVKPVEVYVKRTPGINRDELQWMYHDISKQVELETMRDDLMAMLVHDLQNPLSNIISSLELVEDELDNENEIAISMLKIASQNSERLRQLIRSLLDINRLEAGKPITNQAELQVATLFAQTEAVLKAAVQQKNITLAIGSEAETTVLANRDMIERVIINLLDNAVKFSQSGDTITLCATHFPAEKSVWISVSDEGPGIPAEQRVSIFEKFYRVPENGAKGIGLGLAFCRLAVEAHGGRIWVDESKSNGARFNFTIPLA